MIEQAERNLVLQKISAAALLLAITAAALTGCGSGGGGRTASSVDTAVPIPAPPWYPPSLDQIVRTTAEFGSVTYYLPALESWYLYDATPGFTWISAIGSSPGLSASMTNPFKEVGVMFIPTDTYNNAGQVTFYLDGQQVGTLDLSQGTPYEGYSDDYVSYYKIADGLTETTHTVTMVIATGTVAFDGWRMIYDDQVYNIDCSDANTLEYDTVAETEKLRDGIESFAEKYNGYPDPADFNDLIDYLAASGTVFTTDPKNPFTGDTMEDSSAFSAGDYHYASATPLEYILSAYGGRGTLLTYTEDSAETDRLEIVLTSPGNHFTTSSAFVTFSGTSEYTNPGYWGDAYITICCGLTGATYFPAAATFDVDIFLKEGKNDLVVGMSDPYGHKITLTRTITFDTTSPGIMLLDPFPLVGPVGNQHADVYETPITVRAYVEPSSSATLNGDEMTVDSLGVFETTLDLVPGENQITIVASDAYGNTNTVTYIIVLN